MNLQDRHLKSRPALLLVLRMLAALALGACCTLAGAVSGSDATDATDAALGRCLASPKAVSTADQTDCYTLAMSAYDKRLNAAYQSLLRALPAPAAQNLKTSQRAWLAFRQAEKLTQSGLFESRQGTMYVPMQAEQSVALTRDRVLRLETYVRIMAIDAP